MTQPSWSERLVNVIAGEIKRYRDERGMSAQQLADRCDALGHPIARSVLANLESGRRESVSVPELFVLAQALDVPPLKLVLPLGRMDEIEILPGNEVATGDAFRWLVGESPLPGSFWAGRTEPDSTVARFSRHYSLVDTWRWSRAYARQIRNGDTGLTEDDAADYDRQAELAAEHLREIRRTMRERGLTPPPLPVGLDYIDGEVKE